MIFGQNLITKRLQIHKKENPPFLRKLQEREKVWEIPQFHTAVKPFKRVIDNVENLTAR